MRRHARWATVVAAVAVILTMAGCGARPEPVQRATMDVFEVGDCVALPPTTPGDPGTLRAEEVSCAQDPSYTVGATANDAGACPSKEYQHLAADYVDPTTSRLCLVPNLVASHCYVMELPVGVVERADCTDRNQQGLLVQVTQRLDVRDQRACPTAAGQYAWPYPSPARTYCTLTIF
ncbi:hypothetical protein [Mycolicibacterium grossiae]|uniref:Pyridine nucleotide-disulfide oxidoreductase n=1 Tax=Mycolicibacterium grossiae TaxID=1552759 RepID=A0A1E8Q613_9MYCO|nr:hypothetical protein [Mycolicibacterium grossiae]OFJ53490.1 hypothetical protein BEL07_12100 [Mycolicibacterium grossiae]